MQHLVQTAISWVQTLDAAMMRRAPPDAAATLASSGTWPEEPPPPRKRGRPKRAHLGELFEGDDEAVDDEEDND